MCCHLSKVTLVLEDGKEILDHKVLKDSKVKMACRAHQDCPEKKATSVHAVLLAALSADRRGRKALLASLALPVVPARKANQVHPANEGALVSGN